MRRSAYLFPVVSLAVLLILATAALANQDQREFDINLEVPAWVLIETDVESFDITLGDLADDKVYSNEGVLTILANCKTLVTINQDWSAVAEQLGMSVEDLIGPEGILASSFEVRDLGWWISHNGYKGIYRLSLEPGTQALRVRNAARVNAPNNEWINLPVGNYVGKLIVTVSAS